MPYKTQHGSHYHETLGCHGATIPCGREGLSPCSDCCGTGSEGRGDGTTEAIGSGSSPSVEGSRSGFAEKAEGIDAAEKDATATDAEPAVVTEDSLRQTFWKTSYAYVGRNGGMDRPFRVDISSTSDGSLYWQMTAAYSQIDDALVPIGSSFSDALGDIYIPPAGEWEPKLPRVSEDGTRVGPTFRTMEEALADVNATIARLGITDDTESIAWCSEHPSFLPPSYASVIRSSEATEIGIQAMSDGMPLAGGMTVGSIAETMGKNEVSL